MRADRARGSIWLLFVAVLCGPALAQPIPGSPHDLVFPPLEFTAPTPDQLRVVLPGGIPCFAMRDQSVPLVDLRFTFRFGALDDPPGQEGLAALATDLLLKGGTEALTAEQLTDELERLAIDAHTSSDVEDSTLELQCMTEDLPRCAALAADILRRPRLDSDRLDILRAQAIDALRHRFDASPEIGEIIVGQVLYAGHPAGRNRSLASLNAITQDGIRAFLGTHLSPARLVVSVAGDIDPSTVPAVLAPILDGWPAGTAPTDDALPAPDPLPPGVYIADSPGEQAGITAVALGLRTSDPAFDPDAFRLRVATCALGEIWVSRLVQRVRVREGLAYSVGAGSFSARRYPGYTSCSAQVDAPSTAHAATMIRDEVARFAREGPTAEELATVKESLRGQHVRRFATASDTVSLFADALVSGLPDGFYSVWPGRIGAATADDVLRAARRYLDPASFRWVIAGPVDTILKPDEAHNARLEDLGPVKRIVLGDPAEAVDLSGLR